MPSPSPMKPSSTQASSGWLRRLLPYLAPERRWIAGAFLALLAEVGFRVLEPWPVKFVFDYVLGGRRALATAAVPPAPPEAPGLWLVSAALAVLVIATLRAVAGYWNTIGFSMIGTRVLGRVRAEVFRHLQYLSLRFHHRARGGDLVVRVMNDVSLLQDAAVTALLPLLARLLMLAGMVATMFWMNATLALLATVLLPLFALRTVRLSRRLKSVAQQQRQREGLMAATAAESIGSIKAVQSLALQDVFADAFGAANNRSQKSDLRGKRLAAGLERSVDVFIAAASALVLGCGAHFVLQGRLSGGDLLVFLAYLKTAFRPLQDFAKYTGRLGKAMAATQRVLEILDTAPEVTDAPDARPAPPFRGAITFNAVGFGYDATPATPEPSRRASPQQLRDLDLRLAAGQCVAIVGHSGSGKSTLLSLVLRLYDPTTGTLRIDGEDLRAFTVESVRRQMTVVPQETALFAGTVHENIAFGLPEATRAEVESAARLAAAHEFISGLPQGYDTPVGERGLTLSQGQRQRLAIARAALRDAPILLLDEPTTGLDEASEQAVVASLRTLSRGRTTLWVTHDLRHAEIADLIVHLEAGRVIEVGSHAELLRVNGAYAATYRAQVQSSDEDHALAV